MLVAVARDPDDAGFYNNLGAQRLRERLWFPYGDPVLSGSAAAGYGPVLLLAHVPFQVLLDPQSPNAVSPELLRPKYGPAYFLPPLQATQLTAVAFHLIGVVALWAIARRLAGSHVAWGVLALYCGSPFVLGVGGAHESIGGVTFISHIAPTALALLALLVDRGPRIGRVHPRPECRDRVRAAVLRPVLGRVLLAAAAGADAVHRRHGAGGG